MAAIADGVSKGFKEKDEEAKKLITGNLIKYIVGENRTSHKVGTRLTLMRKISFSKCISCRNTPTDICSLSF